MFRSATIIREVTLEPSYSHIYKTVSKSTSLGIVRWCGSMLYQVHGGVCVCVCCVLRRVSLTLRSTQHTHTHTSMNLI